MEPLERQLVPVAALEGDAAVHDVEEAAAAKALRHSRIAQSPSSSKVCSTMHVIRKRLAEPLCELA